MKKAKLFWVYVASVILALAPLTHGQGQVQLNNRILPDINAKVTLADGVTAVPSTYMAQFALVNADNSVTALTPVTTFRDGNAIGYINAREVTVPGVFGNENATLIMRAFLGADWESALARGESEPFVVLLGGQRADGFPLPPSVPTGLQPFSVTELPDGFMWASARGASFVVAPEPSTIALAVIGGGALLALRRRKG